MLLDLESVSLSELLSVLESGVGVGAEVGGRVDTIVVAEVGVGVGCCRC